MQTIEQNHQLLKIAMGGSPLNPVSEVQVIRKGIRANQITTFAKAVDKPVLWLAEQIGTSVKTIDRHKTSKTPFNVVVSENFIQVSKVHDEGIKYFGNKERWFTWLTTAHLYFGKETPLSMINTAPGRELIFSEINKLRHGFTA